MIGDIVLCPNLAFGRLEMREPGLADIPSWLVDRPDVILALMAIADAGGTKKLDRAPDGHDIVIDLASREVAFREGVDE